MVRRGSLNQPGNVLLDIPQSRVPIARTTIQAIPPQSGVPIARTTRQPISKTQLSTTEFKAY